jgi:hypothetical protein
MLCWWLKSAIYSSRFYCYLFQVNSVNCLAHMTAHNNQTTQWDSNNLHSCVLVIFKMFSMHTHTKLDSLASSHTSSVIIMWKSTGWFTKLFWYPSDGIAQRLCNVLRKSKQKKSYPCNRLWRPIRLWHVEDSTFSRQSAHRWQCGC